jgi:hypothetical protein
MSRAGCGCRSEIAAVVVSGGCGRQILVKAQTAVHALEPTRFTQAVECTLRRRHTMYLS